MRRPVRLAGATMILVGVATASFVHAAGSGIDDAAAVGRLAVRVEAPSPVVVPADQRGMLIVADVVNAERTARGLPALAWHSQVAAAATAHATDMASMQRMQHAGSDGSSGGDRLTRAGYAWHGWGENIAVGFTDPVALVAAWMASPSHRAHLLGDFLHIGIGAAAATDGTPYWALVGAR